MEAATAETIGDLIRNMRRQAGISQAGLADLMHCSQRAISRLEAAGNRVSLVKLTRAARAMGMAINVKIEAVNDE